MFHTVISGEEIHTSLLTTATFKIIVKTFTVMSPTRVKLDEVLDFSCANVQHDRVVDLDQRVWVADGAAVVCGDVGNALGGYTNFTNTAQLVLKHRHL